MSPEEDSRMNGLREFPEEVARMKQTGFPEDCSRMSTSNQTNHARAEHGSKVVRTWFERAGRSPRTHDQDIKLRLWWCGAAVWNDAIMPCHHKLV
jgi:hypothetical protein